jgi:phage shock protein C
MNNNEATDTPDHGVKRLYLSREDKKLAGVCGGIAEYFNIDASIVRLAWILITVITGVFPGFIGYILAAMVIPERAR